MTSENMSEFIVILVKECSKLDPTSSASDIHVALKDMYRSIKKFARNSEYLRVLPEDLKTIFPIVKSLILLLLEDDIPADAMLLCGTCLSLLVATSLDPKSATSFLLSIYCHFDENYSGKQTISTDAKGNLKNEIHEIIHSFVSNEESFSICINSPKLNYCTNLKTPSFQQIAILNGIVSCQILQLYKFQLSQNKPFIIFLFSEVHKCCLSPSIHQYHAFVVLLNWLRMCNMFLHNFHTRNDVYFSENGEIVQKILNLLESNWQSPVKGINGFIKEIYRSIITLNEKECKFLDVDDVHFVKNLLEKTMLLSWQVKGKYFLLSVVLQYIDYSKFFEDYPDAPTHITFSSKANYISSSVAEVYKVIVTNMMKSTLEEHICSEWCNWWRDPILKSLHSNDRLLIQNVTNNILPWTMKKLPKTYQLMMELENQNPDDSVKLLLLRIAKENFFLSLGEKELSLIEKNLHHIDIQVRTEVFSILCSSPKKSESVKSIELAFIKNFILENLNIDSAPFHQYLLSQVNTLLIRIRDSLAQQHRSESQNNAAKLDLNQLEFVDWLTHAAVQNTFPGACFQRRRLSLQLLNVIYDVFIESPLGNKRKEKPSKSVENVIKWAQANNLWLFFKNDLLTHILPCITDFADEIRSLCANLLCTYSSWPTMKSCEEKEAVIEFAVELCNHFDFRNNDGGAHICQIIFNRLSQQVEKELPYQALEFLRHLVSITELQLESAKEDFLSAAVNKPIHGMLLALQYCLADSKSVLIKSYQSDKKEAVYFLKDLASLCFNIVKFMLKIMKGENENYFCPSFSDIGKTFEKLVLAKKNVDDSAVADDKFDNNENSDCIMLSDLLLSCCWHSIKNSCFLLCELSASILALDIDFVEKQQFLYKISKEFSSILIACRHRGVVESCSLALNKFCINLLKDKKVYEDITMGLLQSVFESLTDSTTVSVTRRSAGLPLLFQAVVSSEENNINRQLLSYTIESLLKLIDTPLPSPDSVSEKTDLPQAHAYHILKALVLDARLSQSILPYFDAIIPVCIAAFSSSVWAIRNGALQLFGAILPRVCGQKKVRDDDSEHNMVSAFELFARCPNMKDYLLQELNKCVNVHHERRLCSELVPILSLLVKLVPERKDQRIFMMDFIPLLLKLLDIPVWKVRDLASSALSVLLPTNEIVGLLNDIIKILEGDCIKLNEIHSLLLIVRKFMRRKCDNILSNLTTLEKCLVSIFTIVHRRKDCPLLLGITIDMIMLVADTKEDLNILQCVNKIDLACDILQTQLPGASFCESKYILVALKCTHQSLPLYLKKVSSKNKEVKIICLQFLCDKLNSEKSVKDFYSEDNLKIWREIFISALEYISPVMHPSVIIKALNFMIDLCVDDGIGRIILDGIVGSVMENLKYSLDEKSGLPASALAFTMYSLCLRHIIQNPDQCFKEHFEKWCLLWSSYCQPRSTDVLRLEAAKSIAIVGPSLSKYLANNISSDNFVKNLIDLCEGSLLLLQDEDEDIRYEACKFPSKLPHHYQASVLQFNIGIEVIFQYMLEVLHCRHFYVFYLWNRLQNYPSTTKVLQSYCTIKKSNLFEQEYVNVFAEPQQILLLHQQNFKAVLLNLMKENPKLYDESINMFLCDLEVELQDIHSVLSSVSFKNSNQSFTYHHQVYLALKKLRCQVESLTSDKQLTLSHEPLHSRLTDLKDKWIEIENLLPSVTCWFLNKF